MTANQKISLALLIGRIVTVYIMSLVIRKQVRALNTKRYPELNSLRRGLLLGSVVVLAGNIVPILIDVYGIMNKGSFGLLLAYVFSNNITAILGAYILWSNLKLSEKTHLLTKGSTDRSYARLKKAQLK